MKTYFTSEAVCEGHPDKVCDQIADRILEEILQQDPFSRCACEVIAEPDGIHIMGEITTKAQVNYINIARNCLEQIGYESEDKGLDASTCKITCSLHEQSADIALGVDKSLEAKQNGTQDLGAGDQGMMFGYACDETNELMPLPIMMANKIVMKLAEVRKSGKMPYLYPDGKSQVTIEYKDGQPVRVDTVVVSAQHDPNVAYNLLYNDIIKKVVNQAIPSNLIDSSTKFLINPTGRFVLGGPAADTDLTGRKLMCDTYGGYARHGGGAFSGKDPTKVDRSAAYMARNIAKTIVKAGAAQKCEVQISYAIGTAQPVSLMVETFGTGVIPDEQIIEWIYDNYDLRPGAIIDNLNLRQQRYSDIACYGHFGKEAMSWEKVDDKKMNKLIAKQYTIQKQYKVAQ